MAKKKRRINLKFITIGVTSLIVLAGLIYGLRKTVFRPGPEKYLAQGKEFAEQGDWEGAAKAYGNAIRHSKGPDPTTWLMLGNVYAHLTPKDYDNVKVCISAVDQALQIDPDYNDALHIGMDLYVDLILDQQGNTAVYDRTRKYAAKLIEKNPNDLRAVYCWAFATIEQYLSNVQTDPKLVEQAEQYLTRLRKDDPANAEVPYLQARMIVNRADAAYRQNDLKEGRRLLGELDTLVTEALSGQPENAMMQYKMGRVLRAMQDLFVRTSDRKPTTGPMNDPNAPVSPEMRELFEKSLVYYNRAMASLKRASDLIQPTDEKYAEIRGFYAGQVERPVVSMDTPREQIPQMIKDARAQTEQIYREILEKNPSEQFVRIQLAEFLGKDPNRRDEAIKLLLVEPPPNPRWTGVFGRRVRDAQVGTLIGLCDLRLDQADQTPNPADREALLKEVQGDYDKLVALVGENHGPVLQIKGRVKMTQNDPVAATLIFNRALSLFPGAGEQRYELCYQLAKAFMQTNQTGEAKKLLREVIDGNPTHYLARLQLAELLIKEGNIKGTPPYFFDGAIAQLDAAEKLLPPDNQAIQRLRLLTINPDKEKQDLEAAWTRIPEATAAERFQKGVMALRINKLDEAIRLFELVRAEKPGELDVARALVGLYLNQDNKDKALVVIDEAIAKNPQNKNLELVKRQILDPESQKKIREEQIKEISDPVRRHLAWAQYYSEANNPDLVLENLLAAEKLAPDNTQVQLGLFDRMLALKNWDKATAYMEKLARKNADQSDGQIFRVRLAMAQGDLKGAFDQARKLTEIRGEFAQAWVVRGQTEQSMERFEEAIASYKQALNRQTENLDAIQGLINCYMAMRKPGRASNEATGQRATDARLYIELGERMYPQSSTFKDLSLRWEMQYGDPEKAIAPRAQAVKDKPTDLNAWIDLAAAYTVAAQPRPPDVSDSRQGQGVASEETLRAYQVKARETLAQAAAKFPEDARVAALLIDAHMELKEVQQAEQVMLKLVERPEMKGKLQTTLSVADFYIRANKPDKAEAVLREYLTAHPDAIGVELKLAQSLLAQQRADDALKVLEANADNPWISRQRVETLVKSGRIQEASTFVDQMLQKNVDREYYVTLRAKVDLAMGNIEACRKRAAELLAAKPDDADGLYLRGLAELADPNGDVAAAIEDLNRVVNLQPNALEARMQLGEALQRRGFYDDAIRNAEATIAMAPEDKSLRLRLFSLYANANPPRWFHAERLLKETRNVPLFAKDVDLIHAEARMWLARKEPGKAMELIRPALQEAPDNEVILNTYLSILVESKDYRTLLAECEKQLKAHPNSWWIYQFRAIARRRGSQTDRQGAIADLNQAMAGAQKANDAAGVEAVATVIASEIGLREAEQAIAPLAAADPHWHVVMARLAMNAGDFSMAVASAQKALAVPSIAKADLQMALKLAGVLHMSGSERDLSKAIDCYRRVLKESPNDRESLNNLAYLLLEPGPTYAPTEAVKYSERVLQETRKDTTAQGLPEIMDTHGWALICSGQVDEGISLLTEALEKKRFPEGFYHRGEGYLKKTPPQLLEAERDFTDAKVVMDALAARGLPVDADLKSKVATNLARVKEMRK